MPGGQTSDPAIETVIGLIRGSVWVTSFVLWGLALLFFPLFDVLGYERALACTIPALVAGLDLGVATARRAARTTAPALSRARDPSPLVARLALRAVGLAVALTLIPAVLGALNGIRVPTCDWWYGIKAHVLLPMTTAALAAGAGVALGLLTAGHRAWVPVVIAIAACLALAFAAFWRFYSEPPVFIYSALIGYFPGNLYDEDIRLGGTLVYARLEQLAWVVALLIATTALLDTPTLRPRLRERRPATTRWPELVALAGVLAIAGLLHARSGALGYAIDAEDIQAELGGVHRTEHFVIHYAAVDEIEQEIELIAEDHEFRLSQVARTLQLDADDLRALGTLRSYYFASTEQKAALMGARGVEMAKPWRGEIYLTHDTFPHRSLRHEIAHAVAGLFGDRWFGVAAQRVAGMPLRINPGLIEGLAVAVDWPGDARAALTPHEAVKALEEMGGAPSVAALMSVRFLSFANTRSYTTAGSFIRFLLDKHGATALRRLYNTGGDFQRAYGRSLDSLERDWRAMIGAVRLDPGDVEVVRERFRRGGVFSRPCPHAVAARVDDARRAIGRRDLPAAIRILREVCVESGQEPDYRLALASQLVQGDPDEVVEGREIYQALAGDEAQTSAVRVDALLGLADLAASAGDLATAEAQLAIAAELPVDDGRARLVEAQLLALRHTGPAARALRDYFFAGLLPSDDPDADDVDRLALVTDVTMFEPGLGLGWALRGLQHLARGQHAEAAHALELALARPLPSPRFIRNAARRLAVSAWRVGDRAAVALAADTLDDPKLSAMDRLIAADWRDRLAWRPTVTSR